MITTHIKPAKLLKQQTHQIPGQLLVTDYFFEVPLTHGATDKGEVQLFGRLATKFEKPTVPLQDDGNGGFGNVKPIMCYLEGGPGFGNRDPQDNSITHYLIARGYQVLFLDYRGVGNSSPVTAETLVLRGDVKAQAEYLKHFRADNIVMDLEAVRLSLMDGYPETKRTWSIFGQSFGGFVSLTYLSFFPRSLTEVFLTGGLAPINRRADEVYKKTMVKVTQRNEAYYAKYPEDREAIFHLTSFLRKNAPIALPAGGTLTPERFMTVGIVLGAHGGLDTLHGMVVKMQADIDQVGFLTRPTLASLEQMNSLDNNPLYAVLHEPIYNYAPGVSSNWSAHRVMLNDVRFSWLHNPEQLGGPHKKYEQELYFSGEMIFPFHFDTYPELQKMKEVAEILAKATDWGELYHLPTLEHNTVPVYAASYINDMYVDYDLAKESASRIRGIKTLETNSLHHNAIRARPDQVIPQLFALRDDSID
ncbi:Proline iminopeptidase [Zalerion maritima]|uniref:Proline iminopeptidase n=1 Tax=Zalerion maritima TaxID=339359 RepID=A0AAD5WVY8_9PEZI|nr:Proline iminopeptidase [Zalerion maritima]